MDRFLSNFTNRFDAKGRISVPAPFRAALLKERFEGVFVHPALDSPALNCGGSRLLNAIEATLDLMPPHSRDREDFALALLGAGEILRLDSEGRMLLGARMRTAIGLGDEALFVGQGDKFQIWEPNRFAAHLEQAKSRVRALRSRMAAEFAAGARS